MALDARFQNTCCRRLPSALSMPIDESASNAKLHPLRVRRRLHDVQRSPNDLVDVNSTRSKLQFARHHPGDIEEVANELCLSLRVRVNGIDRSIATLVVEQMIFQHVRPPEQRVERRAQLV
jgi:hypothetical protein